MKLKKQWILQMCSQLLEWHQMDKQNQQLRGIFGPRILIVSNPYGLKEAAATHWLRQQLLN